MYSVASGHLIGNLVGDPFMKHLADGKAIVDFAVAITKVSGSGETKKEYTSFFDVVAFGKTAEFVGKYLKKGSPVYVEFEPKQDRWESDGQKRSRVRFVANQVLSLNRSQTS